MRRVVHTTALLAVLQHTLVAGNKAGDKTLEALARRVDNTYTSQLTVEAEASSHAPNDRARPVRNGHFVAPLRLRPLSQPQLLAVSNSTLGFLGLDPREASRAAFTAIFSGNNAGVEALRPLHAAPWATPYGLSIYGSEQIADGGVGDKHAAYRIIAGCGRFSSARAGLGELYQVLG